MISFNRPPYTGREFEYMKQAVLNNKISGDGEFTRKCKSWLETYSGSKQVFLTTSCTSAMEMAALLIDIGPGDEVIMPSYTFVSTANPFVLRGAKVVFVDIRPDTMNINERLIEEAITPRTKAIVPVHYAGVGCEMSSILQIAQAYGLYVIEDAAQGLTAKYKNSPLGAIGDFGCISFHETKNYSMGEGGCLMLRDEKYIERAEIIREKGTNRSRFFRGEVDKYTWVSEGSSYLPSELNAAYLWAQLEQAEVIKKDRLNSWNTYYERLQPLKEKGVLELPHIPEECEHNGHIFYIKAENLNTRTRLIDHLKCDGIKAVFHYVPLHSAPAGVLYGQFSGTDQYTTRESERLVRLPLYYGLSEDDMDKVICSICNFYGVSG